MNGGARFPQTLEFVIHNHIKSTSFQSQYTTNLEIYWLPLVLPHHGVRQSLKAVEANVLRQELTAGPFASFKGPGINGSRKDHVGLLAAIMSCSTCQHNLGGKDGFPRLHIDGGMQRSNVRDRRFRNKQQTAGIK